MRMIHRSIYEVIADSPWGFATRRTSSYGRLWFSSAWKHREGSNCFFSASRTYSFMPNWRSGS